MAKNRAEYIIVFAVSVLLFVFYHNFYFFYLLLVVSAMPILSYFVSRYIRNKISVSVSVGVMSIGKGNSIPIIFTVDNPTVFPIQGVKLTYTVKNRFYPNDEIQEMSLPVRRGKNSYNWSVSSVYSGSIVLSGSEITMNDYLGIFVFKRSWESGCEVSVIPAESEIIMNVIGNMMTKGDDTQTDNADKVDDVTQVKEFREYRPGDRPQFINWKISAKHDELYVKEFEQEYNRTLTLLVELRADSHEIGFLDELITAFYSCAVKLIDMEIHFSVAWYDCETQQLKSELVSENDGLFEALRQIYLMSSYSGYLAFENYHQASHRKNDTAVYFTSPTFDGFDGDKLIGTFKERVALICI